MTGDENHRCRKDTKCECRVCESKSREKVCYNFVLISRQEGNFTEALILFDLSWQTRRTRERVFVDYL